MDDGTWADSRNGPRELVAAPTGGGPLLGGLTTWGLAQMAADDVHPPHDLTFEHSVIQKLVSIVTPHTLQILESPTCPPTRRLLYMSY